MRRFAPRASAPPRSVPVTTVPRPLIRNARSMARRTGRADSATQPGSASTRSRSPTSPARSSSIPSPVVPDTTTIGAPASAVDASRAATSSHTSPVRSAATRSAFVMATSACRTSSASSRSRCSWVWARRPSSAATTSRAASISPAPTSMLPTSRSWPGTSTKSSSVPSGSVRCAYPTSMVIPRRRSSGRRSASMPVSARRSVVLPWSMWPAVPTTTVTVREPDPAPRRSPREAGTAGPPAPCGDRG